MFFRLANPVGTWSCHVCRANLGLLVGAPHRLRLLNTVTACSRHHHSVLPLVHSAINLVLPSGPFDDPAVTHRASCNAGSIPFEEEEHLLPMFLRSTSLSNPIGFLRPNVVQEILKNNQESGKRSIWNVLRRPDDSPWAVCFADHVADVETRTHAIRVVLERWKTEGFFPDILKGMDVGATRDIPCIRHDENVLIRRRVLHSGSNALDSLCLDSPTLVASSRPSMSVERQAEQCFGSLVGHYRRARGWPGRYDCTVGGGMGVGETSNQTIIRECTEEASLPPDFVKKHARSTGMLNYMNRSPSKWILPGIYYLYELRLPDDDGAITPRTNSEDGEVDAFQLMDVEEVMERLLQGRFKPSSAMALVDFCIRRGIITPESDSGYLDVCLAMRRPVVFPLP